MPAPTLSPAAAAITEDRPDSVFVGNYLLHRLRQLGVQTIFGVPGDFTFGLCDLIDDMPSLTWAGNANELGAAYAADGYARLAGFGAVLTTWGVGELSALNGISGAYAERQPVLHIVGSPPTTQVARRLPIHHSFANGDFDSFANMSRPISCAHHQLTGDESDADRIDDALATAFVERRPAYLAIPTDIVFYTLPIDRLRMPLELTQAISAPKRAKSSPQEITALLEQARLAIEHAQDPVIIADVNIERFGHSKAAHALISALQVPTFATPLSKGLVDESHPLFAGTFVGSSTLPHVRERLDSADLVVRIGFLKTDTNTGGFTADIDPDRLLDLNVESASVQGSEPTNVDDLSHLLGDLAASIRSRSGSLPARLLSDSLDPSVNSFLALSEEAVSSPQSAPITQSHLWPRIGEFLLPDDIVVCDTGTASFGITDVRLPPRARLLSQMLYNSIGWSMGAAVGACMAARETRFLSPATARPPRVVLVIGDGSLQMTTQELSTLLRHGLQPVILVINNSGYTIERALHGPERDYNAVVDWDYAALLRTYGAPADAQHSVTVRSIAELNSQLSALNTMASISPLSAINKPRHRIYGTPRKPPPHSAPLGGIPPALDPHQSDQHPIALVDIRIDKLDAPRILAALGEVSQKRNAYGYAPEYNH